jgi:hypothetical protein
LGHEAKIAGSPCPLNCAFALTMPIDSLAQLARSADNKLAVYL